MVSSMYVICLCSYFAIVFMALLDRFSVVFKCSKTVWGSFAIILMGNGSIKLYKSSDETDDLSSYLHPHFSGAHHHEPHGDSFRGGTGRCVLPAPCAGEILASVYIVHFTPTPPRVTQPNVSRKCRWDSPSTTTTATPPMGSSMGMESTTIAMESSTAEPELFIGTEAVWREATEEPLEPTPDTEEPTSSSTTTSSTEKPSDDLPDDAYDLLANFIASMGIVTLVRKLPCHIPLYGPRISLRFHCRQSTGWD